MPSPSRTPHGASLLEVLVALSIISTLGVLATSAYGTVSRSIQETECKTRLTRVHDALMRYRADHRGQNPGSILALVPQYLSEEVLTCPTTQRRAPQAVEKMRVLRRQTALKYWSSYFYFNRRGLDEAFRRGSVHLRYSDVSNERRGATPVIACYDHREPKSVEHMLSASAIRAWYHPERPVIVLRENGSVDSSRYGGVMLDGFPRDTMADAVNL